jgi:hypothetical protein
MPTEARPTAGPAESTVSHRGCGGGAPVTAAGGNLATSDAAESAGAWEAALPGSAVLRSRVAGPPVPSPVRGGRAHQALTGRKPPLMGSPQGRREQPVGADSPERRRER